MGREDFVALCRSGATLPLEARAQTTPTASHLCAQVKGKVRERTKVVSRKVRERMQEQYVVKFFDKTGAYLNEEGQSAPVPQGIAGTALRGMGLGWVVRPVSEGRH